MRRLILLDRDGTIIVNKHYLKDPAEVELIPGASGAIKRLNGAGHAVVIVSNQSGVARGLMTVHDVGKVMGAMLAQLMMEGAGIDRIFTCPEVDDDAPCRKPNSGMLKRAAKEFNLPLDEAVIVGDSASDVNAGINAGCRTVLVRTGYGGGVEAAGEINPDYVADDLKAAVEWILNEE